MCGRTSALKSILVTGPSRKPRAVKPFSEDLIGFLEDRRVATTTGTEKQQKEVKKAKPYYESRPRSFECIRSMFRESIGRLEDSGWYWGHITQKEAVLLLKPTEVGTFLLRDSSDSRYLFSLSVRSMDSITNVRVLFNQGQFMFDCYEDSPNNGMQQPKFDCIVKLVCYYAAVSQNSDNRKVCARPEDGGDDQPLTLGRPLFHKVPTLQHLARRVINQTLSQDQQLDLRLGGAIEDYMRKYPFSL